MKLATQPQRAVEVHPADDDKFAVILLMESRTGEIGYEDKGDFGRFDDAWIEAQRLAGLYGIRVIFLRSKLIRIQDTLDTYLKLCVEL